MRPTREGRVSPARPGLVFKGIGVDPDVVTEDPEPPVDRLDPENGGQAFVPFLNPAGNIAVVQYKTATGAASGTTVTLDADPTVGNLLVACVAEDEDNGPAFTLDNGTWTQVNATVYSGNGTNWPNRMYYQVVGSGTSATTVVESDSLSGSGKVRIAIVELSGADALTDTGSASNTSSTTDTVTPTASAAAILISATFGRNLGTPALAPAGGMTELVEFTFVGGKPYAINYELVASASGSYTVGSTGAAANSSMIAGVFEDTGDVVYWIDAPFTIDGDSTSFDATDSDSVDAAGLAFWRGTLLDSYLIASMTAEIGFETAGSVTVTLQGANEADYSDAVTVASDTITATGSYTSDDVAASWVPTAVYKYWQLLIDATDGVHIFEVHLFDPDSDSSAAVDEHIADTDDAHDASAISVLDSADYTTATNVEAFLADLAGKSIGYQDHDDPTPGMGATETFDAATGWHSGTLDANCTFTLTAAPTGTVSSLFLELTQDGTGGWDITLPASVVNKAALESAQDTTAGGTSFLVLLSRDGGTTWYGGWWGTSSTGGSIAITDGTTTVDPATDVTFAASGIATVDVTDGGGGAGTVTYGVAVDDVRDAGRWELAVLTGSPPDPLYADGDYLYIWVPGA